MCSGVVAEELRCLNIVYRSSIVFGFRSACSCNDWYRKCNCCSILIGNSRPNHCNPVDITKLGNFLVSFTTLIEFVLYTRNKKWNASYIVRMFSPFRKGMSRCSNKTSLSKKRLCIFRVCEWLCNHNSPTFSSVC